MGPIPFNELSVVVFFSFFFFPVSCNQLCHDYFRVSVMDICHSGTVGY